MTTHITKTWFDGTNIVTQEIPVGEVYKREWVGLTPEEVMAIGRELGLKCKMGGNPNIDFDYAEAIEAKLKEKNT